MGATEVGRRIREQRTARGMSQTELGAGRYSGSYISYIESGRRSANAQVLEFLSTQLGVLPGDLDESARPAMAVDLVEAMLGVQNQLASSQWSAAARQALDAADLARAHGNDDRAWEARYLVAQATFSDGRYVEAGDLAEQLAGESTVRSAPVLRCICLTLASRARRASGRIDEAQRLSKQAVAVIEDANPSPIVLAQALGAVISACAAADPAAASAAATRLEALEAELTGHARGVITWQLGVYELETGLGEAGLVRLGEAIEMLDPQVDMRLWARLNRTLGHYLARAGRHAEASERLAIAASLLRFVGNPSDLIDLHLSQANLALIQGQHELALSLVELSLADPDIAMDATLRAEAHLVESRVREALGDRDAAARAAMTTALAFEEAGALSRSVGAWRRYAELQQAVTQKDS